MLTHFSDQCALRKPCTQPNACYFWPMPQNAFAHVNEWVFDLDNTLYPPAMRLFDQIEMKMRGFMVDTLGIDDAEANYLRKHYWEVHGTTLAGLMREHGIQAEPFLTEVHDISFDALQPDPDLASLIKNLPGRSIVYTNGTKPYAEQVLAARGLDGVFDAIYGIEHADYIPKPERNAFDRVFGQDGLTHKNAAMFEDEVRNLEVPHAMGLRTVHVAPEPSGEDYVHFHTDDLTAFLRQISG
jgi:putative hydrolase of the HAD superfamily